MECPWRPMSRSGQLKLCWIFLRIFHPIEKWISLAMHALVDQLVCKVCKNLLYKNILGFGKSSICITACTVVSIWCFIRFWVRSLSCRCCLWRSTSVQRYWSHWRHSFQLNQRRIRIRRYHQVHVSCGNAGVPRCKPVHVKLYCFRWMECPWRPMSRSGPLQI